MSDIISTEEAERLADSVDQDHAAWLMSHAVPTSKCAVGHALRSLAAERDALREELVTLKSQLEERGKEIDRLFDEIVSLEAGENR
jgi:hypothetical protein